MIRSMTRTTVVLISIGLLTAAPACADPIADFYAGKQIKFIIRAGVGGSYNSYSRLLGRFIGKHIPGNPSVLPINMPGGGGIRAANYVAKVAPQDGTILTMLSQGTPTDQALGLNSSLQADLREFHWVGNVSAANQVLVTWHTSPTKTLDDLMKRETLIGSTQAGSVSVQMPAVLNNIVGTKIKIVYGYPDGHDVDLAMERGEVEGRATNPWASYVSTTPRYVDEKLIIPIIQMGMKKDAGLPNVPLMRDLARNPADQAVLDFMSKSVSVGRPVATTPGVPPERVAALRKAFDDTLRDPEFLAEAKKERAELQPMSGAELEQLVDEILSTPAELRERVKLVIQPHGANKVPGSSKKK